MAVYKIPQDVEAEDKLLGPFTFRQFIFLVAACISFGLMFFLFKLSPILVVLPLPFFAVFLILGIYRRPDQPVEIYLLALVRFYFKPHRRIWDQDGLLETVKVTAAKQLHPVNEGPELSQGEVRNRLSQLANIMDTRGWSVKNVAVQEGGYYGIAQSDRLVMPQWTPEAVDVHESDDILHPYNTVVQNLDVMANQAATQMRDQAVAQMYQSGGLPPQPAPAAPVQASMPVYNPYPNMQQQMVQPIGTPPQNSTSTIPADPRPDILSLSQNNDLSVSTIARQADGAQRRASSGQPASGK